MNEIQEKQIIKEHNYELTKSLYDKGDCEKNKWIFKRELDVNKSESR